MATKIELDKNKILAQLTSLSKVAKKNAWKLEYDSELDELVFGKEVMPKKTFLFNINKELNLFLTPDSNVNGIFIEYFATNYIQHNKDFEPVLEILEEEEEKKVTNESDTVELAKKALENELINEALGSIFTKEQLVTAV